MKEYDNQMIEYDNQMIEYKNERENILEMKRNELTRKNNKTNLSNNELTSSNAFKSNHYKKFKEGEANEYAFEKIKENNIYKQNDVLHKLTLSNFLDLYDNLKDENYFVGHKKGEYIELMNKFDEIKNRFIQKQGKSKSFEEMEKEMEEEEKAMSNLANRNYETINNINYSEKNIKGDYGSNSVYENPNQFKKNFLSTDEGKEFLNSPEGIIFLSKKSGRKFLSTDEGKKFLASPKGKEFLASPEGQRIKSNLILNENPYVLPNEKPN